MSVSAHYPTISNRNEPDPNIWQQIADLVREGQKPWRDSFKDAVAAITRSYQAGYISDEEYQSILRQVVAVVVERELQQRMASVFYDPNHPPYYNYRTHQGDVFRGGFSMSRRASAAR